MAIRSSDQISIIDVTDAYSVMLTTDSYTFPGTTTAAIAGSVSTQINAMCGADSVNASVTVSEITKPTGISIQSDGDAASPTLTISVDNTVTEGGVIEIPVHIGDITIVKSFTFAIAFKGTQGSKGDKGDKGDQGDKGEDAITISITSSNGTIFKNSQISTVLTAHVYQGGLEITGGDLTALGTIKWYKDGSSTATATGPTLTIDAGDVTNKVTYIAQLEG